MITEQESLPSASDREMGGEKRKAPTNAEASPNDLRKNAESVSHKDFSLAEPDMSDKSTDHLALTLTTDRESEKRAFLDRYSINLSEVDHACKKDERIAELEKKYEDLVLKYEQATVENIELNERVGQMAQVLINIGKESLGTGPSARTLRQLHEIAMRALKGPVK